MYKCSYLVSSSSNGERTWDFGGTTTIDDSLILDNVSDHTQGIVDTALSLCYDLQHEKIKLSNRYVVSSLRNALHIYPTNLLEWPLLLFKFKLTNWKSLYYLTILKICWIKQNLYVRSWRDHVTAHIILVVLVQKSHKKT